MGGACMLARVVISLVWDTQCDKRARNVYVNECAYFSIGSRVWGSVRTLFVREHERERAVRLVRASQKKEPVFLVDLLNHSDTVTWRNQTSPAGFEPARAEPNRYQVKPSSSKAKSKEFFSVHIPHFGEESRWAQKTSFQGSGKLVVKKTVRFELSLFFFRFAFRGG